jgi:drug/metabolite transporter (DMT)-like permease
MLFAFACALTATASYGVGTVLQAVGARRASGSGHLDVTLFGRLARQSYYLGGLALDAVGFVAAVLALRTLPLFVVQAAVAGSLGVTAALAPMVFGFRLRTSAKVAIIVLFGGLVLLGASAQNEDAADLSGLGGWVLLAGVVVVAAAGAIAARSTRNSGIALAACAGLGFAGAAIAARSLVVPTPAWHFVGEPIAIALVAYGACGILMFASALQRGSVTPTSAVMLAVETIVPATVGLVALGDRTRPHLEIVAGLGFALTVGACLALARYAEPDQLIVDQVGAKGADENG